jgi:hypothetical protein
MLNDLAYHLIVSILEFFMWDRELIGEENLHKGPDVILADHMGANGPVENSQMSRHISIAPWS